MMSDNKIIQSLWVEGALSKLELLCIQSYIKMGHEFHLYHYSGIPNIPDNVVSLDANEVLSREHLFKDEYGSYATFSDWFKLKMLFDRGNWWVDMDTICLRYFDFEKDYCFSIEHNSKIDRIEQYSLNILKAPAGSRIMETSLLAIDRIIQSGQPVPWRAFLQVFRAIARNYNMTPFVPGRSTFNPITWDEVSGLIEIPNDISIDDDVYAIHFFNSIWTRYGICKNSTYPKGCFYEILKENYEVATLTV